MSSTTLPLILTHFTRILRRSGLFLFFAAFILLGIFGYQLATQSTVISRNLSGLISLPSFIPYTNAYYFSILQAFAIIFLVGVIYRQLLHIPSNEAISARPESNADLLLGIFLAFIKVFAVLGIISLSLGAMIHLFANAAPFNPGKYLFFFFTLILPAALFFTGLSIYINVRIKHSFGSLLILLGIWILNLAENGQVCHGLPDPLGIHLPNAFSSITGHAELIPYLLQRTTWALGGIGLSLLAIFRFYRLPNQPQKSKLWYWAGWVCILAAIFTGSGFFYNYSRNKSIREQYAMIYDRYREWDKMTLIRQDIQFTQQGNRMAVKTRLAVKNQTLADQECILLYLNPGLQINEIAISGKSVPYKREKQVVRIEHPLAAGDSLEFQVNYGGNIDPRVCYLDVSDAFFREQVQNNLGIFRFGSEFAYLDPAFTLLLPESLWYPVTLPPVNPASPFDLPKQFSQYSLNVIRTDERLPVSQGKRLTSGDTVAFRNEDPLPGISLCLASYRPYAIRVDSVDYELYLFRKHTDILRGTESVTDSALCEKIRYYNTRLENRMGGPYPHRRLILAETPASFHSFVRNNRGGSEHVQPQLVFGPERGLDVWIDMREGTRNTTQNTQSFLSKYLLSKTSLDAMVGWFFESFLLSDYMPLRELKSVYDPLLFRQKNKLELRAKINKYEISSMFYHHASSMQAKECPILEQTLLTLVKCEEYRRQFGSNPNPYLSQQATDYLSHNSLQTATTDKRVSPDLFYEILRLKSDELIIRCAVQGIPTLSLYRFISDYIREHRFRQTDYRDFKNAFSTSFQQEWPFNVAQWYTRDRLPRFIVKQADYYPLKTVELTAMDYSKLTLGTFTRAGQPAIFRVMVYNESDCDGIISISYKESSSTSNLSVAKYASPDLRFIHIPVPAHAGICASLPVERVLLPTLSTNLSQNQPQAFSMFSHANTPKDTTTTIRPVEKSAFAPAPGEIIVDNIDSGFSIKQPHRRFSLNRWALKYGKSAHPDRLRKIYIDDNNDWREVVQEGAYGENIRSFVYKLVENGDSEICWSTPIEKKGLYALSAYLPKGKVDVTNVFVGNTFNVTQANTLLPLNNDPGIHLKIKHIEQYYTITSPDQEQEVAINICNASDWVPLGRFALSPGTCTVTLREVGESGQLLLADAVKWVYLGEIPAETN